MNKRGLSPVVATVLLVLVTIVAVTLIAAFIIPFVQRVPEEGQKCFDVLGDLSFHDTLYNCYATDANGQSFTGFSVSINNDAIKGFTLLAINRGSSDKYEIINGISDVNIRMLEGIFNGTLEIPEKGGVRTYVFKGIVESFELYPILSDGKQCDKSSQIEPVLCVSEDVRSCIITEGICS